MTRQLLLIAITLILPALASAQVVEELLNNTGIPIHDFVVSGNELLAVTGGGCGEATVEEGGCPNSKSSIISVDTSDWSTTVIGSVPDANGLPGAALINGSLYALSGESEPDSNQVLLKLDPATGAIEQNYGQIYYGPPIDDFENEWCTDLALVDDRIVLSCWDWLWEVALDETDKPIATALWEEADSSLSGYMMGMVADDNGTLWTSWCDDDSGESNMMSFSDVFGDSPSPVMGPAIPDTKLYMALGHQGGVMVGNHYKYSCDGGEDASWVGTLSRLTWEGDAYPDFRDYSTTFVPVPALPSLLLWLLIGLAGLFGVRRLG